MSAPGRVENAENPNPVGKSKVPYWRSKELWNKVWEVAKKILIGLAGATLFVINPTIFAASFILGLIFDEKVKEVSERIMKMVKKQPWIIGAVMSVGALLALQVTLGAASGMYAARLASHLSLTSRTHGGDEDVITV